MLPFAIIYFGCNRWYDDDLDHNIQEEEEVGGRRSSNDEGEPIGSLIFKDKDVIELLDTIIRKSLDEGEASGSRWSSHDLVLQTNKNN